MAHLSGARAAAGPIVAGVVGFIRKGTAVGLRAGEDVVFDRRRIAHAVDDLALLGSRGLLEKIAAAFRLDERVSVKFAEILGNDRVLGLPKLGARSVVPGTGADAVARIDGRLSGAILSAEVSVPGVIARANCGSQRLAVRVGSGQPAEIAAFAEAYAGDEKGHGVALRLRSALLAAFLLLLGQRQVRGQ